MAVQDRTKLTVDEFDRLAQMPENANRLLEYIGGEAFEVPSNPYVSEIASTISFFLKSHLRERGIKGHITGEAGGYMVSGERYAPDVAFISAARQPELARSGYNANPPELAVEVVSPTDPEGKLSIKVANYLAAGTLIWLVWPADKQVHVYAPGQPVKVLSADGVIDGGDVLPGFTLAVSEIFGGTHG
jgi:Uma2 family endonuclease